MKHAFLLLSLLVFADYVNASALDGRTMRCSFKLFKLENSTHSTNFQFLGNKTGVGIEEVFITHPNFTGGYVTDFKLQGNILSIFNGVTYDNYDIANQTQISRSFPFCVFPGQGGGDSHLTCEDTVETCTLN